jgi:hypothetical protein
VSDFEVHSLTHTPRINFKEIDMTIPAFRFAAAIATSLLAAIFTSPFACAQVSGGGDAPKAASGLGEAMPAAVDIANDPAWQVYEFKRDGIRYLQINDSANSARAAVGQIGSTAWVLPIGRDADRVAIAASAQLPGSGRVVFRDEEIEVVHYRESNQDRWIVRPMDSSH